MTMMFWANPSQGVAQLTQLTRAKPDLFFSLKTLKRCQSNALFNKIRNKKQKGWFNIFRHVYKKKLSSSNFSRVLWMQQHGELCVLEWDLV